LVGAITLALSTLVHAQDAPLTIFFLGQSPSESIEDVQDQTDAILRRGTTLLMNKSGLKWVAKSESIGRIAAELRGQPMACFAAATRERTAREGLIWIGPLFKTTDILAMRSGLDIQIKSLEDTKGYVVGVMQGTTWQAQLDSLGIKHEPVRSGKLNLQKLQAGRIDFWLTSRMGFEAIPGTSGGSKPAIAYESAPKDYGLVCSRQVPAPTQTALKKAIDKFRSAHDPQWLDLKE
jgi:ABC-type amino acid transport substrate-binding protein